MSEPMKALHALIRDGRIRHRGSPLMRWALSTTVAKEDANSNVFPRRPTRKAKIDPIVASIMATALWSQKEETTSVYQTRGIRGF